MHNHDQIGNKLATTLQTLCDHVPKAALLRRETDLSSIRCALSRPPTTRMLVSNTDTLMLRSMSECDVTISSATRRNSLPVRGGAVCDRV